ncbi:MAG: glucosamine kinase, partial [Microbacteriaceae bacterium]|nr:glucosamine kinase [Microbacteriaceae bacterium]
MQDVVLAIDAGGTSSRAALIDLGGSCLGFGIAGSGNPTSAGFPAALDSLAAATAAALDTAGVQDGFSAATIAMAGASRRFRPDDIAVALRPLGLRGAVTVEPDLLAMYYSGTTDPDGHVLVAGTGSVSARIEHGTLAQVADGLGWLLGDRGSGYWIGHRVVRAVAGAIDGVRPSTALTGLLLGALEVDLALAPDPAAGRPQVLQDLLDRIYPTRPVELARFAPIAFSAAAAGDDIARGILAAAAAGLAETLATVRRPGSPGPVVLGGSVLTALLTGDESLVRPLSTAIPPSDRIPAQ